MIRKRGRKSVAELMINAGPDGRVVRPDAPYNLDDPLEVAVWNSVVNSMPADFFSPAAFPLLIQYCRHCVASDRVAMLIAAFCRRKKISYGEYRDLLAMQAVESANIIKLGRQLRLSPQSHYRNDSAKARPLSGLPAPWDRKD